MRVEGGSGTAVRQSDGERALAQAGCLPPGGALVVLMARLSLPDMHMMVARPEQWVKPMAVAGANQYTFHLEATDNPGALIKDIRENGMKVRGPRWQSIWWNMGTGR